MATMNANHETSNVLSVNERADLLYRNTEILAPMVRASTIPLRILALKYGCDTVYTEEIIDRSILNTERVVNEELQTIDYVRNTKNYSKKHVID